MSGETCSVDGCNRGSSKRHMCNMHYLRWWKSTPRDERIPTLHDRSEIERFNAKVAKLGKTSCWEWTGAKRASGHGEFRHQGRTFPAAAVALILSGSPKPPAKPWALHRCDNPGCVNPRHLYWGTPQDNVDDAWSRHRHKVADERPAAKLTNGDVVAIRDAYMNGASGRELAAIYGMAPCSIYQITSGEKWKSVGGPITRRRPQRRGRKAE